jgi:hypothetical protein
MARRSFTQVDAQARAHERIGVKQHAQAHAARVDAALARGAISEDCATLTKHHIAAFADEVATGLHLDGHDSVATRRTVRTMLEQGDLLPKGRRC